MGIFSRLFNKQTPTQSAVILSGGSPMFTPFSGNAYADDIYRGAVDAIARNAAKLKGTHVILSDTGREDGNTGLNRLLQVRPNPYINAFDLIYRLTTHYYLYNNAFAYLQKDDRGNLIGIYPLKAANVEFLTDASERLYCKFLFNNGNNCILPYADIIHLRRHFNDNDLFGNPNTALIPALELAHTQNQGIISAIKTGANIRGIIKSPSILKDEDLKKMKDRFMADYMQIDNSGGVISLDSRAEYTPIENKTIIVDDKQQQVTKNKIYSYLGIFEKIVDSSYSEDDWAAFYESVIEPIAIQLSLEFTEKIFTQREQSFGNKIFFEANRLQFASVKTKTELIKQLLPMRILTINQALDILNLPSVPDGDTYIQSLNYASSEIVNQYQLGEKE